MILRYQLQNSIKAYHILSMTSCDQNKFSSITFFSMKSLISLLRKRFLMSTSSLDPHSFDVELHKFLEFRYFCNSLLASKINCSCLLIRSRSSPLLKVTSSMDFFVRVLIFSCVVPEEISSRAIRGWFLPISSSHLTMMVEGHFSHNTQWYVL